MCIQNRTRRQAEQQRVALEVTAHIGGARQAAVVVLLQRLNLARGEMQFRRYLLVRQVQVGAPLAQRPARARSVRGGFQGAGHGPPFPARLRRSFASADSGNLPRKRTA